MTERAPQELLPIMPPIVARLAVEISGAKRSPCGFSCAFSSSSTMPGSTCAQRSATFSSRMRLRYFDVSSCRPAPIACPACDVPPPRAVIETPCARGEVDRAEDVLARFRDDDAERIDLVDAGVGGIQGARDRVEPDFAGNLLLELAPQGAALNDLELFARQERQLYSVAGREAP